MATFKPVVFSKHVKSDGTSNIKIRIYHNKDSQYLPTHYYIDPKFMGKSGEVLPEVPDCDMYNFELGEIIQQYRKLSVQLGTGRLMKMSCKDLKEYIEAHLDPDFETIDFVKFSREVISKTKKVKTAEWYQVSIDVLVWYYGKESIDVREITTSRLNKFVEQLQRKGPKKKPLQPGAISNYIRAIRALFNKCKLQFNNDDIDIIRIPHDPFAKVKIPQYRRKRKNIGIDEIKKIRDGFFVSDRENIGRDVFMMQFYLMGININDLYLLEPPKGNRLEYERSKTITEDKENFQLSIRIEPELQEMIDKYSPDGFLSEIKTRYINSYNFMKAANKGLKKICEGFGFQKITTNWARHTWASLARNKAGISKADIDFCLGHVNNDYKMADIYIDIDYSIYDTVNRKVLDLLE